MNPLKLIIKELLYRKISSIVILFTVVVASSVSVAIYTLSKASENETRKIMREQGLNLYIFPKGTNLIDFYSINNTGTFPDKYVDVLAESKTFDAVRHLTGILQIKYPDWKDSNGSTHQIVLFGYKDEAQQKYLPEQELMGFDVKTGTVQVGALIAKNIKPEAPFIIKGADGKQYNFKVGKRLEEGRGMMDQGVSFNLEDLQQVLGMQGKINKIDNKLFGKYVLAQLMILYLLRLIFEQDKVGLELLKNPQPFVIEEIKRKCLIESAGKIIDDILVDINSEINPLGDDFDYKGKLRDNEWVKKLSSEILSDYTKLVNRKRIPSFADDWNVAIST